MRFFTNKIIIKASAEDHVRGFHKPIQNIQDLHDFYAPTYKPYDKNQSQELRDADWAQRQALQAEFARQTPEGLHPLLPGGWVPGMNEYNLPWKYDPGVMENTYNHIKHMNPTNGEMAILSLIMRGWNRDASDPGGQYLQMIANELSNRDPHQGIRAKRYSHQLRSEEEARQMREGFRNNPMHERLKNMFNELSKKSQEDFRNTYGDQGTILHRGLGDDEEYLSKLSNYMDSGSPLEMNPLTSYSPSLRSAMKFAGFTGRNLDLEFYNQIKGGHPDLPDEEYRFFGGYHPKYPMFDNRANLHNLMSSQVRPEDVFLTNNIVGTPSGQDHVLKKENEIWVKPNPNMGHTMHRWAGWSTSSGYGNNKQYGGIGIPISVHKSLNAPNIDIPKISKKIGHYHKVGHSDSMVNANDMNIEPEPE